MAEPKKRLTSTRSGARRSHLIKKSLKFGRCPKCKSAVLPHHTCQTCGYYKGADILKLEEKELKKAERRKTKEEEEAAASGEKK